MKTETYKPQRPIPVPTPIQLQNIRMMKFGIGHAPKKIRQAADELLKTPRLLQHHCNVRFQHFHARDTGRLVGTIATRLLSNGTIDVAAAIVNENQGKNGEMPPTRATGCKMALLRLLSGNRDGLTFDPADANYVLQRGPNTEVGGVLVSPKDIVVINYSQEELSRAISTRAVLRSFPGSQWLVPIRQAKPAVRKTDTITAPVETTIRPTFLTKLINLFR